MNIFDTFGVKHRNKRRFEKRFTDKIDRVHFNFTCDRGLLIAIRLLAKDLGAPAYILAEHLLQLGCQEIGPAFQDPALKENLQRHLLKQHMRVDKLDPRSEPVNKRMLRLKDAMEFLDIIEKVSDSPEAIQRIVERIKQEAIGESSKNRTLRQ